jgi:heat shock protein HslJ
METHSTRTNRRRRRTQFLALSMVLLVAVAACGDGKDATADPLDGSMWEMTSVLNGTDLVASDPTTIATLQFTDGAASGSTGCNLHQSLYSVSSGSITFRDLVQSGSACDPDYTEQGHAFIQAMQAAERYVLSEDRLELTDAAGAAQVVFRPAT